MTPPNPPRSPLAPVRRFANRSDYQDLVRTGECDPLLVLKHSDIDDPIELLIVPLSAEGQPDDDTLERFSRAFAVSCCEDDAHALADLEARWDAQKDIDTQRLLAAFRAAFTALTPASPAGTATSEP